MMDALRGPKPAFSPDEEAVLTELQRHHGRGRAVGLEIVACVTGLSERHVQNCVARLIEDPSEEAA